jgi:hypothetical protein
MDNEHFLNEAIELFSKRFRPRDERVAYDFDSGLHSIVRAIYAEAVRPYAYELKIFREHTIVANSLKPTVSESPR